MNIMAVEERFTELPTVATAQMSDIICAVQGYVSPSNLGLSVQETLQQVYNLFQSNVILSNAGNPNGAVAGTTYQLCWDTTNTILYVCVTTGTASTAVWDKVITLTAGIGITISQAGNNITINSTAASGNFVVVSGTTQSMAIDTTYQADNGSLVTLTLPLTSAAGDRIAITGLGAGGWSIAQNAGQYIQVGNIASTVGVGGSVSSTNRYDGIALVCSVANTSWQTMVRPQAILTIV